MEWLVNNNEVIDVRKYEKEELGNRLREKIADRMFNLPIVIKTGTVGENPALRSQVTMILDNMNISESTYRNDEIEIVRI